MSLQLTAAGLLLVCLAHHAMSGDITRWLLDKLRDGSTDENQNRFHNAVLAVLFVTVLWISLVVLLIVPVTPPKVEMALGSLIIAGTIIAAVYRQAMNIRTVLSAIAGTLILAGNLM